MPITMYNAALVRHTMGTRCCENTLLVSITINLVTLVITVFIAKLEFTYVHVHVIIILL